MKAHRNSYIDPTPTLSWVEDHSKAKQKQSARNNGYFLVAFCASAVKLSARNDHFAISVVLWWVGADLPAWGCWNRDHPETLTLSPLSDFFLDLVVGFLLPASPALRISVLNAAFMWCIVDAVI